MLSVCLAFSAHLLAGDWNEIHPCLRWEDDWFISGVYLNSEGNASAYVGGVFRRGDWFCDVGLVTGYSGGDVLPFGRCGREYENHRLFVAPAYANGETGVVLGIEVFTR